MLCKQNVSRKAILMCLIQVLVRVIYDGIACICSETPLRGLAAKHPLTKSDS